MSSAPNGIIRFLSSGCSRVHKRDRRTDNTTVKSVTKAGITVSCNVASQKSYYRYIVHTMIHRTTRSYKWICCV